MTPLTKPVHRVTSTELDGSFGPDKNRRLAITLIPGDGKKIKDMIGLRPYGTRRMERVVAMDVYRWALRNRANLEWLAKARMAKEKKAIRLAAARQARAEKKVNTPLKEEA